MSLLQTMTYTEYVKAKDFPLEKCEKIARMAGLSITFTNTTTPGELLMKELDRIGFTPKKFAKLIAFSNVKMPLTYYKPQAKVAILVANDNYMHVSKLVTPSIDCDSIGMKLKDLGFVVVTIKNTTSCIFKEILKQVCNLIPEDSYAFLFYAGHGCQICNTKCLLSIDCPKEDIQYEHCITENYILNVLERCKLDLCVFIMDMCGVHLDRTINPQIYESMTHVEQYSVHKNLLISNSCQSAESAYEVLQIECTNSIDSAKTFPMSKYKGRIVPVASQYVNALCTRIFENLDVSSLLDKVHADVEKSVKKQKPFKSQCGVDKRSLHDPVLGNTQELFSKLQEISKTFSEYCVVFYGWNR